MSRLANRLTALKIEKIRTPGLYPDGAGLYLRVLPSGAKGWVFRFMLDKRPRYMGLGPASLVSLAEARQKATDARRLRYEGTDPIEARRIQRAAKRLEAATAITFEDAARKYIAAHKTGWKHAKHTAQWENSIKTDVNPIIGKLPVAAIDTGLVLKVLEPIWTEKPETAARIRNRIELILDWARVRGYRSTGENPARWRGHLDKLLPKKSKVAKKKHLAAMPYADVPGFLVRLRKEEGPNARALEFLILTASRMSETAGLPWREIKGDTWVIPKERMKGGREHRVPLSTPAKKVVDGQRKTVVNDLVFAGVARGGDGMRQLMRRMGETATVHGFRSSFKDWASELTDFPREVVEMALAHVVGNATEAAYGRSDLLDRRRDLMAAWAAFCSGGKNER